MVLSSLNLLECLFMVAWTFNFNYVLNSYMLWHNLTLHPNLCWKLMNGDPKPPYSVVSIPEFMFVRNTIRFQLWSYSQSTQLISLCYVLCLYLTWSILCYWPWSPSMHNLLYLLFRCFTLYLHIICHALTSCMLWVTLC